MNRKIFKKKNLDEGIARGRKGKLAQIMKDVYKKQGLEWHEKHPINHMNVVNAYLDSSDKDKEFGKTWYHDAHTLTKFLAKGSGHPIHVAAGIIANHSPQNGIYQNYHDATRVLDAGKGLGGKGSGIMATEKQAAADDRIFKGEHYNDVLKGHKVRAFAHLLEHGHQTDPSRPRVVVDRHAHSVLSGARITDNAYAMSGNKSKKKYQEFEHHYLNAAEHLRTHHNVNIEPEQLQATTWAWRQRKNQEQEEQTGISGSSKSALRASATKSTWDKFSSERFKNNEIPKVPGHGWEERKKPEDNNYDDEGASGYYNHKYRGETSGNIDHLEPWKYDFS